MFSLVMLWTVWVWMQEYGEPYGLASHAITMYKGVELMTQMWLPAFLYFLDVVFNILLLIGAHLVLFFYLIAECIYFIKNNIELTQRI